MRPSIHEGPRSGYTVLVDGYNVIKRHPAWARLPLEAARRLLQDAVGGSPWPYPIRRIVFVFDGPETVERVASTRIVIRFASPSADADIQAAIREAAHPERLIIISDDRDILHTAKSHGAVHHPTQWLLTRAAPTKPTESSAGKGTLPAATARQITEELAARWLRPGR